MNLEISLISTRIGQAKSALARKSALNLLLLLLGMSLFVSSARGQDCNSNGVLDAEDIAQGTSPDCNANAIPDECDFSTFLLDDVSASDAAASDQFGFSLFANDDLAIVGAPGNDDGGFNSGSAYIFERIGNSWLQMAKLNASDPATDDFFGRSVAIDGDYAIVGSNFDDDLGSRSGSAYIFRNVAGTWQQEAKLTASDGGSNDRFGTSVAIAGETAIIGAVLEDEGGTDSGAAYVFTRSDGGWQERTKLLASDSVAGDQFGNSLAISGTTALIGAERDNAGANSNGSVYVFVDNGNGWVEIDKLVASDFSPFDQFGHSVAIQGNTAIIGSINDDDGGTDSGAVYVFRETDGLWQQVVKLTADDAADGDNFGIDVAIEGSTVVVGAHRNDDGGSDSGSAYLFREEAGVWQQVSKLITSNASPNDEFGFAVGLEAESVLVGSYLQGIFDEGVVFNFLLPVSGDCNQNSVPDECDSDCNSNGVADECEANLGVTNDCNENGVPDDCDIDATTSLDCNLNAIPDECDVSSFFDRKVFPADADDEDEFGRAIGIEGDTLVIGAEFANANFPSSGAAYIFELIDREWVETAKIVGLDVLPDDRFGRSVAIDQETIVVGSPFHGQLLDGQMGAAYIFRKVAGAWQQVGRLSGDDISSGDRFGIGVAICGDTVLVGAAYQNGPKAPNGVPLQDFGAAYLFRETDGVWQQIAKLRSNDIGAGDLFGESVAVENGIAVVSSRGAGSTGAVYIFEESEDGWSQVAKLQVDDPDIIFAAFGRSVSISNGTVLVGADSQGGAAYVYRKINGRWQQVAKLISDDREDDDRFGSSVSIEGDTAVIGALYDDNNGFLRTGSAYVFREIGGVWNQIAKAVAPDATSTDLMGTGIDLSNNTFVAGAIAENAVGPDSGAAYIFSVPYSADCDANSLPDECESDMDGDGTTDACDTCPGYDDSIDINLNGVPDGCDFSCDGMLLGDVSGNGDVDQADVPLFVSALLDPDNAASFCTADVNNDGALDGLDVFGFLHLIFED